MKNQGLIFAEKLLYFKSMRKGIIFVLAVLVILALVLLAMFFSSREKNKNYINIGECILFYGKGCPHCANVENFLEKNNLKLEQKEVYYNNENKKLLLEKAKICQIDKNSVGVPLLWDEKKSQCLLGEEEIINFLNQKIK